MLTYLTLLVVGTVIADVATRSPLILAALVIVGVVVGFYIMWVEWMDERAFIRQRKRYREQQRARLLR